MKKKRAKLHENAKQTAFDEAIIFNSSAISHQASLIYADMEGPNSIGGSSVGFMLMRRMPERQMNAEYLQEQSNFMMARFESVVKTCTITL